MQTLKNILAVSVCLITIFLLNSCHLSDKNQVFEKLSSTQTGIDFSNTIQTNDTLNVLIFEEIYNGAGVGVGDLNNDGLTDIFFAGNQVSSRLYLNKGKFQFQDITQPAHVRTQTWCNGVTLIDINQDGKLDIYLTTITTKAAKTTPNLLFINQGNDAHGIPVFKEAAKEVGLADESYSVHATFLDYDQDGDLDMYLLTNSIENYNRNAVVGQGQDGRGRSVDKLYRNDGNTPTGLPVFTDVSKAAGILAEGWGLGVMVNDINQDGYPDVYVANDFLSNDLLYINNGNGTFTNRIADYLRHQSHNSMGIDIADFNNDALNDVVVVDMLPDDNLRQKTMFSNIEYDRFQQTLNRNYQPQYVRNVFQVNNGNQTFSDIGYLTGVAATDWSWSPLLADFDNDGLRDLLITNGYRMDITDLDFVTYRSDNASFFDSPEMRKKNLQEAFSRLKGVKKPNFFFKNTGNYSFQNASQAYGLDDASYSNGTAYADFDNDGDLDLVMNNIDDEAFIYKNRTLDAEADKKSTTHFLRTRLQGDKPNLQGLGAKITLYAQGKLYYAEHQLQRGYKSTIEATEHFGLGSVAILDSLKIVWASGKQQMLRSVHVDQVLVLSEKEASLMPVATTTIIKPLFQDVTDLSSLTFKHEEIDFVDFKIQHLLHRKYSQGGPALAVGDINGDQLDDVFVGGSAHKKGVFFTQTPQGNFRKMEFVEKDEEDTGVLLFDADNDGDNDLYCVSGSSEFGKNVKKYQDRLYRNDGKGNFTLDITALPRIEASGSCVTACDFDKDGDLDLFVGGRIMPLDYPTSPQSYLLQNDGKGHFTDIAAQLSTHLPKAGMVTTALWTDFNNDGWTDLALAGEFMPVVFFKNEKGQKLTPLSSALSAPALGWWNSLTGGDFDNDGDIDYVAGNIGLNTRIKASDKEPVCVYAKDYDHDGLIDPLLCYFNAGTEYTVHPRGTLIDQMIGMRRRFQTYAAYGNTPFSDMLTADDKAETLILKSNQFASCYFENKGNGTFNLTLLPVEAQVTPIFGMVVRDVNQDGNLDILAVGNDYSTEVLSGRYDAGIGLVLLGNGKGQFQPAKPSQTGFLVKGDAKSLVEISLKNGTTLLLASQNQDWLKTFSPTQSQTPTHTQPLQPYNTWAEVQLKNGKKRRQEFYYGSGYLSASSRIWTTDATVKQVIIH